MLLVALTMRSQSTDSTAYTKLDIGFSFSPDYCYRTLKTEDADSWMGYIYDTMEVSKYGYTSGLNIAYHVNHNFSITSGILLSDKGERTKKYNVQPVNNYVNHFYYLDIPVKANLYLHHKKYFTSKPKKISYFLTAGFSVNVYLSTQLKTENIAGDYQMVKASTELSRVNLAFIAGAGLEAPLSPRWFFKLEPNYRKSITKIADAPIKKYLYSFGLNAGIFCRF